MTEVRNIGMTRAGFQWRALAVLMALCLALGQLNGGLIVAYAQDGDPTTLNVGANVTAQIADGVLTLSGTGDTDDFTAETAPFAAHAAEVRALEIEDGITYLGSCLFYGLAGLEGDLTLPESIVGFGDSVFSGPSLDESPRFTTVRNLFESGDVVQQGSEDAGAEAGYTVERAVEQEVVHPETLFAQGQSGEVTCSDENASFLAAALSAGYRQAGADEPETPTQDGEGDDVQPVALLDADADADASADSDMSEARAVDAAEPLAAVERTIYLDQAGGDDANNGASESMAVKTLAHAADLLTPAADGGSVDTNRIVIVGTYTRTIDEADLPAVPFTLSGAEGAILTAPELSSGDYPLYVYADFRLENIKIGLINHIYGNGYDLTVGEGITGGGLYLYGFGNNDIDASFGKTAANITVKSGRIERIIGYVRSKASLDCSQYSSNITVDGSAFVARVVAGSASGGIQNGKVSIAVKGGTVNELIGGNQGYQKTPSPYSGKTSIVVSGGKVVTLYGAGSGRDSSIPTYVGELDIDVKGGSVQDLYGVGSAASMISENGITSQVNVSVSGGKVDNIFAAGKGWDTASNLTQDATVGFVGVQPDDFGSLTGNAKITVGGDATVGNIYASGQGYRLDGKTKRNAYLKGNVTIEMSGGTVTGSIYGGGKGVDEAGYEECARVADGSDVHVVVSGGTVRGDLYGGGEIAKVEGSKGITSVTLSGGEVQGNVYGGGKKGLVEGATLVSVEKGIVQGSVFGGALGDKGKTLVLGGSTVNMTGGQVNGNLYGGSRSSDDGVELADDVTVPDLIITNLVGGTVRGNVFGGGYEGEVHGSTHMHVGVGAMFACLYYQDHKDEIPSLEASPLSLEGSVYAGGDYGDGKNYDTITVSGTSHVYIDGTGYDTGAGGAGDSMAIGGGVFGSGASCDAGSTRLVTLKNYGAAVSGDVEVTGATRTLTAIQRADRVLFINSHVRLIGQSDVANAEESTKYSLNRIGDHGSTVAGLGDMGNGLVLQSGSTVVLESPAVELAAFRSLDSSGGEVALDNAAVAPNTLLLNAGTSLYVSYTYEGAQTYGPVRGYTRLLVDESKNGYVYARLSPNGDEADGGFVGADGSEVNYTRTADHRYWRVQGTSGSVTTVETVLTAKAQESGDSEGFAVVKGTVKLPPADQSSRYTVKNATISSTTLNLVEAAKSGLDSDAGWRTSYGNNVPEPDPLTGLGAQKKAMQDDPVNSFGLFMKTGSGFSEQPADPGKIVSLLSMIRNGPNTVIGAQPPNSVTEDQGTPSIEFYLTYCNNITASRDAGTVTIELERSVMEGETEVVKETTTVNVKIVTKATELSDQTIDLYATQSGTYTEKLSIPSGVSRKLTLTKVEADGVPLVEAVGAYQDGDFAVSMQAMQGDGVISWDSSGLMSGPCDLGGFASEVPIGTTDGRYEAPIEFVVTNAAGFSSKDQPDTVVLTIRDGSTGDDVEITLRIHWEKSAVSSVSVGAGRQYNGLTANGAAAVSQKSALTAVYELSGTLLTNDCWLELRNNNVSTAVPEGAKFTLMSGTGFYWYTVTGAETDGRIDLKDFASMSGGANASSISGDTTVILDLSSSTSGLATGSYSLVPRNDKAADGPAAVWTVEDSSATATLDAIAGGDGLARGTHKFELSLSSGCDTRFADGATAAFSLDGGASFPEGTVFVVGEEKYYPSHGKVYVPLADGGSLTVAMDTTGTAGLSAGLHKLSVQVFPTGASAGIANALSAREEDFTIEENPSYALSVSLDNGQSRVVSAREELHFTARYSVDDVGASPVVTVRAQKKTESGYADAGNWTVSGNDVAAGSGSQAIIVTVPDTLDSGTYRLLFTLGDQTVPYNIIVQES